MDFSKFLSADFDAKNWINAALANADSTNVEQSSNTLILKLQMSMQEVSNTIEDQCNTVTQQLPRLLREMDTVKQEALLLQHQMNEVRREVELCEQNTANSMHSIVAVDRLKTRMQAARKALEDADNWQLLSNELEDLLQSAQSDGRSLDIDLSASLSGTESSSLIMQIVAKLTKMRVALNALAHVANYAERAAYFDKLASRFEALVRDELRLAMTNLNDVVCSRWHAAFARLERSSFFRSLWLETSCDALLRRVGAAWNETRSQEQKPAAGETDSNSFEKRVSTLNRFVDTVLRTIEREGYSQHFSFIVTVFGDDAALVEVELVERCVASALLSSSDALFVRTLRSLSETARSSRRTFDFIEALVAAKRLLDTFASELRAFLTSNFRISSSGGEDTFSPASNTFRTRFAQLECVVVSLMFAYHAKSRHFLDALDELLAAAFNDRIDALAVESAQRASPATVDELSSFIDWLVSLCRADWFAFERKLFTATLALGDAYAVPRFFSQMAANWPKMLDEVLRLVTNRFDKHRSRSLPFLLTRTATSGANPSAAAKTQLGDVEYQATLSAFASALQVSAAFGEFLIELFRFVAFCAHILTDRNVPRRIQSDEFQAVTASAGVSDVAVGKKNDRAARAFAFTSADEKQTCVTFLKKLLRNYASVSGETDMLNLVSIETRPKIIRSMRTALQQRANTFQNSVAFDLPAAIVRRSLASLPNAIREVDRTQSALIGDLPLFSFAPSACVTQLGEFLMLVPQTLDLHATTSLCATNECREPHLIVLVAMVAQLPFRLDTQSEEDATSSPLPHARSDSGSRTRLDSTSQTSPKTTGRERTVSTRERHGSATDFSPTSGSATLHQLAIHFVNGWLESVVRFALARACDELFENVRSLTERSTKQLLVDLNYLLNVADDLGVQRATDADGAEKQERIDTVQRALQLGLAELTESERASNDEETRNVFAAVLKMRNAGLASTPAASNPTAAH